MCRVQRRNATRDAHKENYEEKINARREDALRAQRTEVRFYAKRYREENRDAIDLAHLGGTHEKEVREENRGDAMSTTSFPNTRAYAHVRASTIRGPNRKKR